MEMRGPSKYGVGFYAWDAGMKKDFSLVLIDGSSYLFRAFHALPQLVSSKGQPTGAIKGVISMIRKLISDYQMAQSAVTRNLKVG